MHAHSDVLKMYTLINVIDLDMSAIDLIYWARIARWIPKSLRTY